MNGPATQSHGITRRAVAHVLYCTGPYAGPGVGFAFGRAFAVWPAGTQDDGCLSLLFLFF